MMTLTPEQLRPIPTGKRHVDDTDGKAYLYCVCGWLYVDGQTRCNEEMHRSLQRRTCSECNVVMVLPSQIYACRHCDSDRVCRACFDDKHMDVCPYTPEAQKLAQEVWDSIKHEMVQYMPGVRIAGVHK